VVGIVREDEEDEGRDEDDENDEDKTAGRELTGVIDILTSSWSSSSKATSFIRLRAGFDSLGLLSLLLSSLPLSLPVFSSFPSFLLSLLSALSDLLRDGEEEAV